MLTVRWNGAQRSAANLAQALVLMNDSSDPPDRATLEVIGPSGPLVKAHGPGRLIGLCLPGDPRQVYSDLLEQACKEVRREDGTLLAAWEMTKLQWRSIVELPTFTYSGLPGIESQPGLAEWFREHFRKVVGFGTAGPTYNGREQNTRHIVHVAYALNEGKAVPTHVIEAIKHFPTDMRWLKALVTKPHLRGRLTADQIQALQTVVPLESTDDAVIEKMIRLVRQGPEAPTYVQVDDMLYGAGLLGPLPVPPQPVADLSQASTFALEVRSACIELRLNTRRKKDAEDRAAGRLSIREIELHQAQHQQEWHSATATYGMLIDQHIAERDIEALLELLDFPDDWNRGTKQAIQKHFGIRLLGVSAQQRRQAIYRLVGMDESEMNAHQIQLAEKRRLRKEAKELAKLQSRLEAINYRLEDGHVLNAKRYVERIFNEEGAKGIYAEKRGASTRYWAILPNDRARPLKAADGTLEYARYLLNTRRDQELAQQEEAVSQAA